MYDLGGNMPFFHLDKEKCKKDGICSAVCVTGIIKNDDERSPYIDEKNAYTHIIKMTFYKKDVIFIFF